MNSIKYILPTKDSNLNKITFRNLLGVGVSKYSEHQIFDNLKILKKFKLSLKT